jgi:hypothetical protein
MSRARFQSPHNTALADAPDGEKIADCEKPDENSGVNTPPHDGRREEGRSRRTAAQAKHHAIAVGGVVC